MDIFFCDECANRVTSVHLRRGHGARSGDVVICASCIEAGKGVELLDREAALVGSSAPQPLAGSGALDEARDRANTAWADEPEAEPSFDDEESHEILEERPEPETGFDSRKTQRRDAVTRDAIGSPSEVAGSPSQAEPEHAAQPSTVDVIEPSVDQSTDLRDDEAPIVDEASLVEEAELSERSPQGPASEPEPAGVAPAEQSEDPPLDLEPTAAESADEPTAEERAWQAEAVAAAEEAQFDRADDSAEDLIDASESGDLLEDAEVEVDLERDDGSQSDNTEFYTPIELERMQREEAETKAAERRASSAEEEDGLAEPVSRSGTGRVRRPSGRTASRKSTKSSGRSKTAGKSGKSSGRAKTSSRKSSARKSSRSSTKSRSASGSDNRMVIIISAISLTALIVIGFAVSGMMGSSSRGSGDPYAGMNPLQSIPLRRSDIIDQIQSAIASNDVAKLEAAKRRVMEYRDWVTSDFRTFVMSERDYDEAQYTRDAQAYTQPVTRYLREVNEQIQKLKSQGK